MDGRYNWKKWQDGGTENRGELQLSQEQAVNLKQCRNRAYSKVELAKDSHIIKDSTANMLCLLEYHMKI